MSFITVRFKDYKSAPLNWEPRASNACTPFSVWILPKLSLFRDRQRQVRKWQKQQAGRQNYQRQMPIKSREASVTVKADWIVIEVL